MKIEDLIVEVRDSNLERVGQILPVDLVGLKIVARFNNVGSWEIKLPVGHPVGEILRQPGSGIVVTGPTGVLFSGPTTAATNSTTAENPAGEWSIQGVDDSILLGERLAYPTPASADVTAQTTAYDTRTGLASAAMYGYVQDNIAENAPVARQIPALSTATDTGLGSTVYPAARFDILGELLAGIASVDGLGFDIKQVDGGLEFRVFEPEDRSAEIRMDVENNTLSKTEYAYGQHAVSRAIVAGQGEGADRQFVEITSSESLSAETLWGRRIESFVDQRNTANPNELAQAGAEKLADGGATLTSVDVVPSSDLTMAYAQDWNLGDRVTVVVGGQEVAAIVTTVSISIGADGIRVGATVGEPAGVDYEALVAKKQTSTSRRVNALERKESASGGGSGGAAGLMTQAIKNDQGASVSLGQAVYISGANGTNVLVKLAKADAEITSSKTMGLLAQNLATNGLGDVVTEGMLGGIDTSAASDGDPVWLSPTTAGGLVYGIANKPVAPNHLVFIGFVLRANPSNGEIYVKIQNGFENDELHDRLTFIGDSAPASPKDYYYWFNTTDGTLSFRYNDGDSSQWVQINNGAAADAALTNRVTAVEARATTAEGKITTLEGVRPVSIGGTGASTLTSGGYLKGNGTSAVTSQTGIPATDITSGLLGVARMPSGSVVKAQYYQHQGTNYFASTSLVDLHSGLRLSFTPTLSTSTIVIIGAMNFLQEGTHRQVIRCFRDSGQTSSVGYDTWYSTAISYGWTSAIMSMIWQDTAGNTPGVAKTYSFKGATSAGNIYYNYNFDGQPGTSNYVIMEIAA